MIQLPDSTLQQLKIAPQTILTSDSILSKINAGDQIIAFFNMINWTYVLLVVIISYFIITQVKGITTIKSWQETAAKVVVSIIFGAVFIISLHEEWLHILVSFTVTIVFYEGIWKAIAHFAEARGWITLPREYVDEKVQAKIDEIAHLEKAKAKEPPFDRM